MLDFPEIKLGTVVVFNDAPCAVIKCDFAKVTKLKPVKKCKLRNCITNNVYNHTFNSGDRIEAADIERKKASYLYQNGDTLAFMVDESFETIEVPMDMLGGKEGYLKEGLEVDVLYFNENPVAIDLPIKVSLLITYTTDIDKGNSTTNVMKEATTETGMVIKVPPFMKIGDKVIMNTVEDEYAERDTSK
jgi:elongation factor P